jgi:predicted Zn-dependent peptidase
MLVEQSILTHRFPNGLTLLVEPMEWLESAAFALLLPAGCAHDPLDRWGLGSMTCEMVQRGCGERDSRQFVNDLENLGVDHSASVSNAHTSFGGAMPHEQLYEALTIHADLVRRPHLPADQFEDAQQVCLQEVYALEDDLAQRMMQELRRRRYGDPYGRSSQGSEESVSAITLEDVQQHFAQYYQPQNAILSVAGKVEWDRLREHVEQLFGDWPPQTLGQITTTPGAGPRCHIPHESSQTHLGIAYPSVPYSHPDYYQARGAVGVLSDGMSSRLFTEVREKRGLVYTVSASCHSLRHTGSVLCYAGTTTDRAQETLDVIIAELERLTQGIEAGELSRLKARIKSSLIFQQESSPSRAGTMAADWYHLGRVKTLEEVSTAIDALTVESINYYLAQHPPRDYTIVTLGEQELNTAYGVS